MIKHSRREGCEEVGFKKKKQDIMELTQKQQNEMENQDI